MKRNRRKCCFTGCENTEVKSLSLNFFSFPIKQPDICQQWMQNCINNNLYKLGKKVLALKVVCEIHFEKQCFFNEKRDHLKENAVPTLPGVEDIQQNRDFDDFSNDDNDLPPILDIDLPTKEEIKEEEEEYNNQEEGGSNDLLCCMCNKFSPTADGSFRENLGSYCDGCYVILKTARRSEWMSELFEEYKSCVVCLNMVFNGLDVTLHDCTSENLFCCNNCNVIHASKDDLVRHLNFCNNYKISHKRHANLNNTRLESSYKKRAFYEFNSGNFLLKRRKIINNHGCAMHSKHEKVKKKRKNLDKSISKNNPLRRKGFKCDFCKKLYTNFDEFVLHISKHSVSKHDESSDGKYHQSNLKTCIYCHKSFKSISYLKNHLLIHFCYKPYNCMYCDKSFKFSSNLNAHLRVHNNDRPYSCPHCDWSFRLSHHLKDHLKTHKIGKLNRSEDYTCNKCFKIFTRRSNLKRHDRYCDSEPATQKVNKLYTCDHCKKSFSVHDNLISHLRIHTGEKNIILYTCGNCHKSFTTSSDLTRHARTHTGEKPYRCKYCNTFFNQGGSLYRHIRRKHL